MAYQDDLNSQYSNLYNAYKTNAASTLASNQADVNNQINQTNDQYSNLINGYKSKLSDTANQYTGLLTDLNNQQTSDTNAVNSDKTAGDQGYATQGDQTVAANVQQTNKVRDWMAAHNLSQSGENVDAMLSGQANLSNGLQKVNTDHNTFDTGIAQKITDLYNTYASKQASTKQQEQSDLNDINNNMSGAQSTQTTALQALQAKLAQYTNQYNSDLSSEQQSLDAQKAGDLSKYQLQQESEAASLAQQRDAEASPASTATATKATVKQNASDATDAYNSLDNFTDRRTFLIQNKDAIVSQAGQATYDTLLSKLQNDNNANGAGSVLNNPNMTQAMKDAIRLSIGG
jgi:uncharacterized phage infection (PIP) family protein YhgE